MATPALTSWLAFYKRKPQATLQLFCFPYAGGSALIYRNWAERLPPAVELCLVQLPGRGSRIHESPFKQMQPLVEAAARGLSAFLEKPFAFFGHSMGAVISFELARLLRREHAVEPIHLFISGRTAPHLPDAEAPTYALPEEEFLANLRKLEGTPREVLENPELMKFMQPLLRADFETTQTYIYRAEPPLNCPISVFGGLKDPNTGLEVLEAWRQHTTGTFSAHMFPGNHFFINTESQTILQVIAQKLSQHELNL